MGHLRGEYATFITKYNLIQNFLLIVDVGRGDPNTTKSGPSSAHQRNDI